VAAALTVLAAPTSKGFCLVGGRSHGIGNGEVGWRTALPSDDPGW